MKRKTPYGCIKVGRFGGNRLNREGCVGLDKQREDPSVLTLNWVKPEGRTGLIRAVHYAQ